ncbi:uncharacterized protein LOC135687992 [Rhopilema esculentum]|uniref:uncharacterized protein LOC135687992 n=1 Tax=Rhopilema esculentum TaxID=499914 RepID=UPI0031D7F133
MTHLLNPFEEEGEYLLAIHTKDVKSNEVIETVRNAKRIGEEHFNLFLKERFVEKSKPVSHPIKKMCLSIFDTPEKKKVPADKAKLHVLQQDCSLFSRLYIACQFRDGNLEDFFKYENQPWPPSLSQFGQLREGQKADLINCLTSLSAQVPTTTKPSVDAVIIDGAVIVQMLQPKTVRSFDEYFTAISAPYILRILQNSSRIDLVWDVYKVDSLKKSLRDKRGSGQRRKVMASTRIPTDWKGFLKVDENKDELFKFLANKLVSLTIPDGKEIYTTYGDDVLWLSSTQRDVDYLVPCSHEEADTRLIVHARDATLSGHRRILIKSNDTDVVVLAVSVAGFIQADEVWVTFGSGKNMRYIPAHIVAKSLGTDKASALPVFHALTGCDTVSFFGGRGKKTAWEIWKIFPQLTPVLMTLKAAPTTEALSSLMPLLERFVVLLYDRTSSLNRVDEARQELFSKNQGVLMASLLRKQPSTSTLKERYIKEVLFGVKRF